MSNYESWLGAWASVCLFSAALFLSGAALAQPITKAVPPPAMAIALSDVATESESATGTVREIQSDLSFDRSTEAIAQQLPLLTKEIDNRLRETRKIVLRSPSIEMLRTLEGEWQRLRRELSELNRALTRRINDLEGYIAQLDQLDKIWDATLTAGKQANAPAELVGRIQGVAAEIKEAREEVEKQRARALTLQNRVGVQDARIADVLRAVDQARENLLARLLRRDGAPIWSRAFLSSGAQQLQEESLSSFSAQWTALSGYAERHAARFGLGILIFIAFAVGLFWTRQLARKLEAESSESAFKASVFETPIPTALLLALFSTRWINPQAPRLLWVMLGAVALIPSVIIVDRIIAPNLRSLPYVMIAFFFFDLLRTLAAAVPFLPGLLFLIEMLGVISFSLWVLRLRARPPPEAVRRHGWIILAAYIALLISSLAFLANILGYVTLSNLLGNSLLGSGYTALILYALVVVLDQLGLMLLHLRPLTSLGAVSRHRLLLHRRMRRGLDWLAVFLWVIGLLQMLLLREPLLNALWEFVTAELSVGSVHISLGDVLAFILTVWAAFALSRFVRFLLEEDVYPRVHLKRGLAYAISSTLHYCILVGGFFLGVAALGFDMTRVTILAGAFGVGIGFGLQNIVNNFISGLIVLFERPINIGDVIKIEDASGIVERIGIRASVIRSPNGAEIIVPNGKLISERLTNWTLSNRQHVIELPVAVAQGSDPERVVTLLERTAAAHPLIRKDPPPKALVAKLGPDSLGFELRAWSDHSERWMEIRSDMAIAISSALAAEKISLR